MDNLGRSHLTLRRNVLHFKKVSDILCVIRRQAFPVASRLSRSEGTEQRREKGEGRHERQRRAIPPLKSVVIHGPVLRGKKNTPPPPFLPFGETTDASRVALQ